MAEKNTKTATEHSPKSPNISESKKTPTQLKTREILKKLAK